MDHDDEKLKYASQKKFGVPRKMLTSDQLSSLRAGLEAKGFTIGDLLPSYSVPDCRIEPPVNEVFRL
jgi:hypothetical protein